MTHKRLQIALAAATLVVFGGVGWFVLRDHAETLPVAAGSPSAVWPIGERRVYSVELESKVRMGEEDVLDVRLDGQLRATRVQPSAHTRTATPPSDLELAVTFEPKRVELTSSPEERAALVRALQESFKSTFTAGGLVRNIGFPNSEQPEPATAVSRGLLRTIIASFQVSSPPSPSSMKWVAEEPDAVGLASTRYERQETEVKKTKSAYIRVTSNDPLTDARTELVASTARLSMAGAGLPSPALLLAIDAKETTRVRSDGPLPQLSSELTLRVRLLERADDSANAAALARALQGHRTSSLEDRSVENRMTLEHAKLKGPTFIELVGGAVALSPDAAQERARLFAMLKAQLRFDAENVKEAARLVRSGHAAKALLIDALGAASTTTSQEVLRGLVTDATFGGEDRRRALIALSFVERPSSQTLELFRELTNTPEYRTQALYGLGTAAYNLQSSDPGAARVVTAGLAQSLAQAREPADQVTLLKALGNAGTSEALASLESSLQSPDAAVRATAVWALRRVPGERAEQALALALTQDPDTSVRHRALDALAYRSPSPVLVYALRDGLEREKDAPVRRELVRAAMRWARGAAVLIEPLKKLASADPDSKVRELLRDFRG